MSREELITKYFKEGHKYDQIKNILSEHNHKISLGYLKVLLKTLGLKRKYLEEDIDEIVHAIVQELGESGQCMGYKSLWLRLKLKYGLDVYRETVLELLHILDPEGIESRSKYGIKRREYLSAGPFFCIHIDGYDKLKPYGFAIHSGTDGFSRKCLWLNVATTNNKPEVIANYYLKCVNKYKKVPALVRSDLGTENSLVECLQIAFRLDHTDEYAGANSCVKGKSTANQRVESFWGHMRRRCIQFWISYFKDMMDEGHFYKKDPLQLECLRYCFVPLISFDLEEVKHEWNRHTIRRQKRDSVIPGKPNYMFYMPEQHGGTDSGFAVPQEHIDRAIVIYAETPHYCSEEFMKLVDLMIPDLEQPTTSAEARQLYHTILDYLNSLDNDNHIDNLMDIEGSEASAEGQQ